MKDRPCKTGCGYPALKGRQFCRWHALLREPADVQARAAQRRLLATPEDQRRARVPKEEWPDGERWCAGCQTFVPLFYATGSRCKACASTASHGQRIEREYGITREEYDELFAFQRGRCYICQRAPRTKRLAVDHDHRTGEVRGLLCAHNENGCNRAVVANLEAATDGGLMAARRAVAYFEHPPYARMKGLPAREEAVSAAGWLKGTPPQSPPF